MSFIADAAAHHGLYEALYALYALYEGVICTFTASFIPSLPFSSLPCTFLLLSCAFSAFLRVLTLILGRSAPFGRFGGTAIALIGYRCVGILGGRF